jgi:hypothetical protein
MSDYSDIQDKIFEQLTVPYVYYAQESIGQKKMLAIYISSLDSEILLIPSAYIFSYDAVIAGLTEKQIEYISKNAPREYKNELVKTVQNEYKMKEVFEIVKMMDEDLGDGNIQNQKRIKSVYRYILDNWAVLQF